jgi:hypothetical protein
MDSTMAPGLPKGAIRVPLTLVRPTMVLARPVLDREGRVAVGTGTVLGPRVVQILRRLAIQSVPVVPGDEIASWERIPEEHQVEAVVAERFGREPATPPMAMLREAVLRCFERRARELRERDPAAAARASSAGPSEASRTGES